MSATACPAAAVGPLAERSLVDVRAAVTQAGLHWHGEPIWARYDAPWKPWFMRRNEIMLELD